MIAFDLLRSLIVGLIFIILGVSAMSIGLAGTYLVKSIDVLKNQSSLLSILTTALPIFSILGMLTFFYGIRKIIEDNGYNILAELKKSSNEKAEKENQEDYD